MCNVQFVHVELATRYITPETTAEIGTTRGIIEDDHLGIEVESNVPPNTI